MVVRSEKELARAREYKKEHRAEIRLWERQYRAANPDIIKAVRKREYEKNKTRYKQYSVEYRERNYEKLQADKKYYHDNYYSLWTEALLQYSLDILLSSQIHSCPRCGESDLRCLQIDHIKQCGSKNRISGRKLYVWIIDHTEEAKATLQVLCANCNWRKRYENNETRRLEVLS